MRETKNIKVFNPFVVVLLLAGIIVSSCNPKTTHLTQSLDNSGVPGQRSTQTAGASTQNPGQEKSQVQSSSSVFDPTATSNEPLTTQSFSETSVLVLTPTHTPTIRRTSTTLVPTQTRTSTPTLTATATPTKTATFTLTPTLQTGWEGEWSIYVQQADGTYTSGTMNLALNGTNVIASANLAGVEYNFEGDIYAEGKQITGPWQTDSSSGYFWWILVSGGQFGGSQDLQYGICGARAGAEKPDPCLIYPPS